MHRGRDRSAEAAQVAPEELRRTASARPARLYVVRADLAAGTVSVLWPAGAPRRPPRPAPRRGREGRSSP